MARSTLPGKMFPFLLLLGLLGCSSLPKQALVERETDPRITSFLKLGQQNYQAGNYEQADAFFEQALLRYAAVDNGLGVSRSFSSRGRVQLAQGNLTGAESCFQEALVSCRGMSDFPLQAQALDGLARVALQQGQTGQARQYLDQALALPLAEGSAERAVLLHDLGITESRSGNAEAAEKLLGEALTRHEVLWDSSGIAADCFSLAQLLAARGAVDQALLLTRRALENDKKAGGSAAIAQDLTLLGSLVLQQADVDAARDYFRRAELAWSALGREKKVADIRRRLDELPANH